MKRIEELPDGSVRIGAQVRSNDLAFHLLIRKRYPMLSEALLSGNLSPHENMATVERNLLERPKYAHFFNTAFDHNKRLTASTSSAIKHDNDNHQIVDANNESTALLSDMSIVLAALDAQVNVSGPKGDRSLPVNKFHLAAGETIKSIDIPPVPFASNSHYLKVRDRVSYEFASTSAAVALDINDGTIRAARLALGGLGNGPWRSLKAEQILTGAKNHIKTYQLAADVALKDAVTGKYNTLKAELAKRTIVRALQTVGGYTR